MKNWKTYMIAAALLFALAYAGFLYRQWQRNNQGALLPSAPVAEHAVNSAVPLQAKDKQALRKRGEISRAVATDSTKEVTATGTKKDSAGTTHVAAVLDTATGRSVIIQQRPMAEFMARNAIGLTVEANGNGIVKEAYYSRTFGRVWDFYASGGGGARIKEDNTREGFVRLNAELRF